jgi:hypothetical protein
MTIKIINKNGEHIVCEKLVLIPNDKKGYAVYFGAFDQVPDTYFNLTNGDKLFINGTEIKGV